MNGPDYWRDVQRKGREAGAYNGPYVIDHAHDWVPTDWEKTREFTPTAWRCRTCGSTTTELLE